MPNCVYCNKYFVNDGICLFRHEKEGGCPKRFIQ